MGKLRNKAISMLLIACLTAGLITPGAASNTERAMAMTAAETGIAGEETLNPAETEESLGQEEALALPKDVIRIRPYSKDPVAAVKQWDGMYMYAKKGEPGIYKDLTFRAKLGEDTATVNQEAYTKHYGQGIYVWEDESTGKIYAHNDLALEYSDVKIEDAVFTKDITYLSLHLKGFMYTEEKEGFNTRQIRYSDKGKPLIIWEIDETGKKVKLSEARYNDFGSIVWERTMLGNEITYTYEDVKDKKGKKTGDRLLAKTYSDGTSDKYGYDEKGRMNLHINADETIEEFGYDSEDRLTRHTTYDSKREKKLKETITTYEEKITTKYPDHYVEEKETTEDTITGSIIESKKEYYVYKAIGKIKKKDKDEAKARGYKETIIKRQRMKDGSLKETEKAGYEYYAGQLWYVRKDGKITMFIYDSKGNLTETKTWRGEEIQGEVIETTKSEYEYYEEKGESGEWLVKRIKETDETGTVSIREYDREYNMTCYEDSAGYRTYYEYDKKGNVTKITSPKGNEIKYEYDQSGRLRTITDAKGGKTYLTYDAEGRITEEREEEGGKILSYTSYEYDEKGRVKRERDKEGKLQAEYTYDKAGNVTSIKDGRGNTTKMTYDELGHVTSTTTATGKTSYNTYDEKGNLIEKRDENGNVSRIEYDEFGNITKTIDREENEITFTYDEKGRQTSTLEGEKLTRFEYDEKGNITKVIEANGAVTESRYNKKGKVTYTKDAAGREEIREYNLSGNLVLISDGKGNKTELLYDSENYCWKTIEYMDGRVLRMTIYEYDPLGNITQIRVTDGAENTVGKAEMEYDAAGRLTEERNGLYEEGGRINKVTYEYDSHGLVTKKTYEDGKSFSLYEYDECGNLIKETYTGADGKRYEYTYRYNEDNQLVSAQNPAGINTIYTYTPVGMKEKEELQDKAGNILGFISYSYDRNDNVKEVNENGIITSFSYDALGRVTEETDAQQNKYLYTYDEAGNITKITYPDKGEEKYEYDYMSRLTFAIDAEGGRIGYIYDEDGNQIAAIDARGYIQLDKYDGMGRKVLTAASDEASKTEYIYDEEGRVKELRLGEETLALYLYDEKGRLIKAQAAEGMSRILSKEEEEGKDIIRYEYDILDRLLEVTERDKTRSVYEYDILGRVKKESTVLAGGESINSFYEYDVFGRLISSKDANGAVRQYEYDSLGNVVRYIDGLNRVTEYTYDISGNLKREKDYQSAVTSYSYDILSRLTEQTDPLGNTVSYEYDVHGNLKSAADAKGNISRYFYDDMGNLIRTEDAMGNVTIMEYDSMGRTTAVKVQRGDGLEEKDFDITRYEYDKRGLVVRETNPLSQEKSYSYDSAGNLIESVNEKGEVTSFKYNYMNLVEQAVYPSGERAAYQYDMFGNMTGAKNSKGSVIIERDSLGRIINVKDEHGNKVGYSYDSMGNLTEILYPDRETVSYSYDEEGRLKEVRDSVLGTTTIIHDDKAGEITKNYANGEKTVYSYDKAGNIKGLKEYMSDSSLYMDIEYGYDENGNRTKEKYLVYEGRRGEKEEAVKENIYEYDSLNRLAASISNGKATVYQYDRLSNLVMEESQGEVTKYTYNRLNQLTEKKNKDGITGYTYDALGNRIRESGPLGVKTYTYDDTGRLIQGINEKGEISKYGYSPLGMRTEHETTVRGEDGKKKTETTYYVVDYTGSESNDLLAYTPDDISGHSVRYTYAGSERIGQTVKELTSIIITSGYNVHEDIMGSVSYITDKAGKIYQKAEYDVWGRPTITGDRNNKFFELNYTGHSYDEILGMYYAQARFYDPVNKVFTSKDPAGYGTNWYSYCSANPVTYYDPTGMFDEQSFYEQSDEEKIHVLDNPVIREEFLVGIGVMALGLIIGAVVPGAMMLVVNVVLCAAEAAYNCVLEATAAGEILSDKELNKRMLRGAAEGLIMGAGGMACVKAAEAYQLLKPVENCAVKASKIANMAKSESKAIENGVKDLRAAETETSEAANLAKRWAINGIGNGATGLVSNYVGNLIEGKSAKESFDETLANAPQIIFTSFLMATADTMVQLHVSSKCFVAGTPVLTEEGNVNIEDVEAGDKVFAYDEETGKTEYKEVVRLFRNTADELVHVTILTEDGREETITSTIDHPYYVKEKDAFVDAQDLEEGTILMLADGTWAKVVKVTAEKLETPVTVYNFEVKDFHTYYVGDSSVLVHNMCGPDGYYGDEHSNGSGEEYINRSADPRGRTTLMKQMIIREIMNGGENGAIIDRETMAVQFRDALEARNLSLKDNLDRTISQTYSMITWLEMREIIESEPGTGPGRKLFIKNKAEAEKILAVDVDKLRMEKPFTCQELQEIIINRGGPYKIKSSELAKELGIPCDDIYSAKKALKRRAERQAGSTENTKRAKHSEQTTHTPARLNQVRPTNNETPVTTMAMPTYMHPQYPQNLMPRPNLEGFVQVPAAPVKQHSMMDILYEEALKHAKK